MGGGGDHRALARPPRRDVVADRHAAGERAHADRRCRRSIPARTLLNRLWPLLFSTLGAGALGIRLPQVPAVAAGFAVIWALAWRRQSSAVTAIEERDGARFYVERTSPLRPDQAGAHPGFTSNLFELNGARAARDALGPPGLSRHRQSGPDGPTSSSSRSAARPGGGLAARELVAVASSAPARETATVDTGPAARRAHVHADRLRPGAGRAPGGRSRDRPARPAAVIYCSITAALLWPQPGRIWLDAIAAENRPGRHGVWQRTVERRRLRETPLVLTMATARWRRWRVGARPDTSWSCRCRCRAPGRRRGHGARRRRRRLRGDPVKKRAGLRARAWSRARRGDETLVVDRHRPARSGGSACRFAGRMAPDELPGAAAARAGVRRGLAARGLRDRPARGAGRRLPCS